MRITDKRVCGQFVQSLSKNNSWWISLQRLNIYSTSDIQEEVAILNSVLHHKNYYEWFFSRENWNFMDIGQVFRNFKR